MRVSFRAIGARSKRFVIPLKELDDSIKEYMKRYAEDVVAAVREYPAEPVGSRYIRTFDLYRSWEVTEPVLQGDRLIVHIGNTAVDRGGRLYADYVQGIYQTMKHKGTGWLNIFDYLDRKSYRDGLMSLYKWYAERSRA